MQLKEKLTKAIQRLFDHLNEPLEQTHPQIEFIPPMLFRLVFYALVIGIVIGLIGKAF
mgnify:CR=1 FL=1